jgi:hypothetical protein
MRISSIEAPCSAIIHTRAEERAAPIIAPEELMVKMLDRAWKHALRMLFYGSAILTLSVRTALGQGRAGVGTWGFVNVRYDTRAPASIYTGYGWHAAFAMGGVLHNPRTGYAELVGGVGAVIRTGAAEQWLVFAMAETRTSSFVQIYWLPSVRTGSITSRANVKLTVPLGGRAARKISVSPLAIALALGPRLSGGVAVEMAAAEGARTRFATGLELRFKIPGAALGVDALHDVTGNGAQVRLFCASIF